MAKPKRLFLTIILLISVIFLGLILGNTTINFENIFESNHQNIILQLRLPRVLTALAAGGLLALNGVLLQTLTQNPLSDAGLLGTSSGAASAAALSLLFGVSIYYLFLPAFLGAIGASCLIILLANRSNQLGMLGILLGGMAINSLCSALLGFFHYLAPEETLRSFIFWSLGSCAQTDIFQSLILIFILIIHGVFALKKSHDLDAFLLGEGEALYLGVNINVIKYFILISSAVSIAFVVSWTGFIGFIGLLVPHFVRFFVGVLHQKLMIYSVLWGGIFLIFVDIISRTIWQPLDIPVGILTALLGAPFFLLLLFRKKSP